MAQRKYILQESGSITLPADFRKKYDLKAGDEIVFVETADGLLISPRETLIEKLLDDVGNSLRQDGITLDELMTSGREIRKDLLKELYDIDVEE
ncbi:MAG: AbrB/MazE/SpoVT family DNA-binding domain-containing protein [Aggregatilineales bacterium]